LRGSRAGRGGPSTEDFGGAAVGVADPGRVDPKGGGSAATGLCNSFAGTDGRGSAARSGDA